MYRYDILCSIRTYIIGQDNDVKIFLDKLHNYDHFLYNRPDDGG